MLGSLLTLLSVGCSSEDPICKGSDKTIEQFLRDSSLTAQTTADSVRYIISAAGDTLRAGPRDTVTFNYVGKTLDNDVFDDSDGTPISSILAGLIPGFRSGLSLVGQGGSIKMFIPSYLAYGNRPPPGLCPNTDLIFDVDLDKIGVFVP